MIFFSAGFPSNALFLVVPPLSIAMRYDQQGNQSGPTTIGEDQAPSSAALSKLDLTGLPNFFVLPTHLSTSQLHEAEDEIHSRGGVLTYDIKEANIVLGNISKERRAKFELHCGKVRFEDIILGEKDRLSKSPTDAKDEIPARKRRKFNDGEQASLIENTNEATDASTTDTETEDEMQDVAEDEDDPAAKPMSQLSMSQMSQVPRSPTLCSSDTIEAEETPHVLFHPEAFANRVKVVKLDWLKVSLAAGKPEPFEPYTIYEAKLLPDSEVTTSPHSTARTAAVPSSRTALGKSSPREESIAQGILARAKADPKASVTRAYKRDRVKEATNQDFVGRSFTASTHAASQTSTHPLTHPPLVRQSTSEHDEAINNPLPSMPDWVKQNKIYSCERATPLHPPNEAFIDQLKKIKLARELTDDRIGVRAYSTSIASIAAYPHSISSTREVLALPGCDHKIVSLFHEFQNSHENRIQAVSDFDADPIMSVLRLFYEIWGVGAKTARQFYYSNNWRDLDDIIEQGWHTLSRQQQIGLKYYDELQLKIPRSEVESIAATVTDHARCITDSGIECAIVGGYRRGKLESGDVDLILSHRSEAVTYALVEKVLQSLEAEGWITYTLSLTLTNIKRNQQPLPLAPIAGGGGHGFDTLDKALVVWQSQNWPTRSADLAADPSAENPNPHRRVDIIISPWRTVGCAVAGWTSGTTFQRDLRRYAKNVKGWKFDSSGVRESGTGRWIDLEGWREEGNRAGSWEEAEKRVFEGMGLVWREPWERCTG